MPGRLSSKFARWLVIELICVGLISPIASGNCARKARRNQDPQQTPAPSGSPAKEDFKFEKVDLELLEQVNLLDARFKREGLVLEDDATAAYLDHIAKVLVPRNLQLQNVSWHFRALRDPQ